jgi:hypothetical protein
MFDGSRLKIKRANKHIDDLGSSITAYIDSKFYGLGFEKNPQTGKRSIKFEIIDPMPCDVPLFIGDAIHNLRCALDLAAWDIVTMAGGTPSKYLHFPFANSRQDLVGTINGGEIKIAGKGIIDLIVDVIKPYKGGNDALYGLHDLDILDKHRILIPVISIAAASFTIGSGGKFMSGLSTRMQASERGETYFAEFGDSFQIEDPETYPSFHIIFGNGQPFESEPIFPTLHQLSQLISGILDALEKALFPKGI